MIINKEKYIEIKDEVVKYSKEYQTDNNLKEFSSHITDKINNFKPTIMMYGTYNAGKSTLINALFGKDELAKTGDTPETSIVTDYEYNGYTIYDTPGINAPQEHEEVTNKHLKKCELVLFVLSNDGSIEERYIYERIIDIVKLKKPILIVVNNKAGIKKDSPDEIEQFKKININLTKIGKEYHLYDEIETKVNISMVNAKTALKAKIENKGKILFQRSNIIQLESEIDKLLNKAGSSEVQNSLNIFISKFIESTLKLIDEKIDNPEMKKTQEAITYLENLKQRTYIELQNSIKESSSIVTRNLLELFLQKDQKQISIFMEKSIREIQERLNTKLKNVSNEVSSKIDNFNNEFSGINLQNSINTEIIIDESPIKNSFNNNSDSNGKEALMASAAAMVNVVPPVIPIGPVPVPARLIAQVALTLFGIFSGSNEAKTKAEAEMNAKREQHLGAKNKADEFGYEYKNKLSASVDESINSLFNPSLENLLKFSKQLDNDNTKLLNDKNRLTTILNNFLQ